MEPHLVKYNLLHHHPDPPPWQNLVQIVVPEVTEEARCQTKGCGHVQGTSPVDLRLFSVALKKQSIKDKL